MSTPVRISNTIKRLQAKDNWDEFEKDYKYGDLISPPTVKVIIEKEQKKNKQQKQQKHQQQKHQQKTKVMLTGGKRLSELPRRTNG